MGTWRACPCSIQLPALTFSFNHETAFSLKPHTSAPVPDGYPLHTMSGPTNPRRSHSSRDFFTCALSASEIVPSLSFAVQSCRQFGQLQVTHALGAFAPKREPKNDRLLGLSILAFGESQIGHCIGLLLLGKSCSRTARPRK